MTQNILLIFLLSILSRNAICQSEKINQTDKNGMKQGHWIYYGIDRPETQFPDSSKVEEGDYVDDRKSGRWIKYNENGTIKISGEYRNNRPFDPRIQLVLNDSKIRETSATSKPEVFIPPVVSNCCGYGTYYIAPKYATQSYFPLTYIGENTDSLYPGFLSFVYPTREELQEIADHVDSSFISTTPITKNNLSITFTNDRYWVAQPMFFGEDTMEYHSASAIILRNISSDTLLIGQNMKLSIWLQYFDGQVWKYTDPNPSYLFELPEMIGSIVLFPNEIVVTAIPLFEGEKRNLRIVIGDCISDEFNIVDNQARQKY